jgi:hypothetical protein
MFAGVIEASNLQALNQAESSSQSLVLKKVAKKAASKKVAKKPTHKKATNKFGKKGKKGPKYHLPKGHEKFLRIIMKNGKKIPVLGESKLKLRVWPLATKLSTHFIATLAAKLANEKYGDIPGHIKKVNKENPAFNLLRKLHKAALYYKVYQKMMHQEKKSELLKYHNINTWKSILTVLMKTWPNALSKSHGFKMLQVGINKLQNVPRKHFKITNIFAKIAMKYTVNTFRINKKAYEKTLRLEKYNRLKKICENKNTKMPAKKDSKKKTKKPVVTEQCKKFFATEKKKREELKKKAEAAKKKAEAAKKGAEGKKTGKGKKAAGKGKKAAIKVKKQKIKKAQKKFQNKDKAIKKALKKAGVKTNELAYKPNNKLDEKIVSWAHITPGKMRCLAHKYAKMIEKLTKLR